MLTIQSIHSCIFPCCFFPHFFVTRHDLTMVGRFVDVEAFVPRSWDLFNFDALDGIVEGSKLCRTIP